MSSLLTSRLLQESVRSGLDLNEGYPDFKPFKVFMSGTPVDSTPTDVLSPVERSGIRLRTPPPMTPSVFETESPFN